MRDVQELLGAHEGTRLDLKRDLSSIAKVVRTLAAMGNTAGGHVVIGVDDDGTVPGLAEPLKDEEALSRAVADSIEPLLPVEISVQHVGAVRSRAIRSMLCHTQARAAAISIPLVCAPICAIEESRPIVLDYGLSSCSPNTPAGRWWRPTPD